MRTVVLAGIRSNASRLVATGLAVVLAVSFLVATLAVAATFLRSTQESLTAGMAHADVWVGVTDDVEPVAAIGEALDDRRHDLARRRFVRRVVRADHEDVHGGRR